MNKDQLANPYHIPIVRGDITRAISGFIPEVLDETVLAIEETFKAPLGTGMYQRFIIGNFLTIVSLMKIQPVSLCFTP